MSMRTASSPRLASALLGALALMLALPTVAMAQPSATATPACNGNSCWGLEPTAAGCGADARTVGSVQTPYGLLELRYSPACRSNWARLSNHPSQVPTQFEVENTIPQTAVQAIGDSTQTTAWTNMVSGIPLAQAKLEDSNGNQWSTGWH